MAKAGQYVNLHLCWRAHHIAARKPKGKTEFTVCSFRSIDEGIEKGAGICDELRRLELHPELTICDCSVPVAEPAQFEAGRRYEEEWLGGTKLRYVDLDYIDGVFVVRPIGSNIVSDALKGAKGKFSKILPALLFMYGLYMAYMKDCASDPKTSLPGLRLSDHMLIPTSAYFEVGKTVISAGIEYLEGAGVFYNEGE